MEADRIDNNLREKKSTHLFSFVLHTGGTYIHTYLHTSIHALT